MHWRFFLVLTISCSRIKKLNFAEDTYQLHFKR